MSASNQQGRGLWDWRIVQAIVGVSVLYFSLWFLLNDFNEGTARHAIALSARIAVVLFCLAFGASAFHFFIKNSFSWWLRMNRKYIGISFAILHLIHLSFLVVLQQNFHPVFDQAKTISLLGGGLAYLFVVLMLATSFSFFSKYLSKKQWAILHTVGGYWVWFIFIRSYVKKAMNEHEYILLVALLVAVVLFRFFKIIKSKK